MNISKEQVIKILRRGGVGVLPTDTIYGLVGQALNKKTVERIYAIRQRQPDKPLIILISSLRDLKLFGVKVDKATDSLLKKYWPGAISIVLPVKYKKFSYLHRGTDSLAFRLPAKAQLANILRQAGPLVAPSANPEGQPPAVNLAEARKYFSSQVDFYFGSGKLEAPASTLIKIIDGKVEVLRQGAVKI